jgi:hypothetical protein
MIHHLILMIDRDYLVPWQKFKGFRKTIKSKQSKYTK